MQLLVLEKSCFYFTREETLRSVTGVSAVARSSRYTSYFIVSCVSDKETLH